MPSSRLEVDLHAVDHNLRVIRSVVSPASRPTSDPAAAEIVRPPASARQPVSICAVLKQDAYSLGAVRIAKRIASGLGPGSPDSVEMIAVYALDEARELAESNITTPTLILKPVRDIDRTDPVYRAAAAGRLHLTLHDLDQLAHLERLCTRLGFVIPVHVFVDTGLARGGALPSEAAAMVQRIIRGVGPSGMGGPRVRLAGVMTHFASPCDDAAFTREQAASFREWVASVRDTLPNGGSGLALHAANTCATFRSEKYHGTMVRMGQSLYGYGLDEGCNLNEFGFADAARSLKAAVRWLAPIVQIKDIPPGHPVGYGSTWRAPRRHDGRHTRIALVPVGYADGYPRSLGNRASAGLNARPFDRKGGPDDGVATTVFAPVVGRVSMDQICLDVTEAPESHVFAGSEVELVGADRTSPNYLPALASAAGTITHELLARINPRIERAHKYHTAAAAPPIPISRPAPLIAQGRTSGGHGGPAAVAR
ncbi:MAG: alanine racemase [Phycisphaeraceae bacterium]|nr:alanine racemase [Phycisphaeraceae bacterium]